MDLQKITQDICAQGGHWHWPLFAGLLGALNICGKNTLKDEISGLGEAPGDNILPKEILISFSSRRGLMTA